jgi:hypothetical protein
MPHPRARTSTSFVLLTVLFLAFALTCAAAAQAVVLPGPVTGLASSSHPDASTWYSNSEPVFSWASLANTVGFSWVFDQSLTTTPPDHQLGFATTTAAVSTAADTLPWEAAVGDFNNDGKLDVATANYGDDTVSVIPGNSDGTFGNAIVTDTGFSNNHYGPHSVAVGNFNNDGNLDLAVADFLYGRISILLGKGDGTFDEGQVFLYGSPQINSASSVIVADFNGDGDQDLAVADYHDNCVSVLLGHGDGTFGVKAEYAAGTNAEAVTTADFNHDNKADLAVANWGAGTVSVLLGIGDGTFATAVDSTVGSGPHGIATGDFNGDGWADLAVANWSSNSVSVLLNDGTGAFPPVAATVPSVGSVPSSVAIGDYDGDGHQDVAVADQDAPGRVTLLFGKGDGTFYAPLPTAVDAWPHGIASGDFDGDGRPDIVVTHAISDVGLNVGNTISLLRNVRTTAYPTTADGLWYFHIAGVGADGVTGATTTRAVRIDTTAPATTIVGAGSHNTPVTLTFTALDPNAPDSSGVNFIEYKLGAASWAPVPTDGVSIDAPTNHNNDGKYTILYRSQDNAGNLEGQQTATVKIDTRAPQTTAHGADTAWHAAPVTLTFTASDPNAPDSSGVDFTQYKLDAADWVTGSEVTVSGDGTHTVLYRSQDKIGNPESQRTVTVKIDTTPPTVTASGVDSRWHRSSVRVALNGGDGAGSGVMATQYRLKGTTAWLTAAGGVFTVPTSPNGNRVYEYRALDWAGNASAILSATVKIDTGRPVAYALSTLTVHRLSYVNFPYKYADTYSPTAKMTLRIYTSRGKLVKTVALGTRSKNLTYRYRLRITFAKGSYTYRIYATDLAGNASSTSTSSYWKRLTVR